MLSSRLRSTLWFLKRPTLYPQFVYLAWDRLTHAPEPDTTSDATAWCHARAVSFSDAITRLFGRAPEGKVEEIHSHEFAEALRIEKNCPEWMGGPGDLNLLYHCVRMVKARRVVETGVAYGWSSLAILLGMENEANGKLISSDMPYVQGCNDDFVGCVVFKPEWRAKWKLIRKSDRQVLPGALRELGEIDLCHYDSDKSYRGRAWAYPLLWQALRSGGIFLTDDISDNLAFRDFAAGLQLEPIVVLVSNERHTKYVGLLRKP